jgi:hypothetical protein
MIEIHDRLAALLPGHKTPISEEDREMVRQYANRLKEEICSA